MPITIKTGTMKYKKPNGEYEAFNAVAQESTDAQIASIQSAGSTQISNIQSAGAATIASIPNDYTTLTNNVSQLSEEIESIQYIKKFDAASSRNYAVPFDIVTGKQYKVTNTSEAASATVYTKVTTSGDYVQSVGTLTHGASTTFTASGDAAYFTGYINNAGVLTFELIGTELSDLKSDIAENASDIATLDSQVTSVETKLDDVVEEFNHTVNFTKSGAGNYNFKYAVTAGHKYKFTNNSTSGQLTAFTRSTGTGSNIDTISTGFSGGGNTVFFTASANAAYIGGYASAAPSVTIEDLDSTYNVANTNRTEIEKIADFVGPVTKFQMTGSGTKYLEYNFVYGKTYIIQNDMASESRMTLTACANMSDVETIGSNISIGTAIEYTPSAATINKIKAYTASANGLFTIMAKDGDVYQTSIRRTPFARFNYNTGLKDVSAENAKMTWTSGGSRTTTAMPQVYDLFDALVTNYGSYVSRVDAVEEMDMEYPVYANGIASDNVSYTIKVKGTDVTRNYMITPAYKTYMYKLIDTNAYAGNGGTRPKKKVLLVGAVHGNEIASAFNAYLLAHQLCTNTADKDIFELRACYDFYIVPCVNGYGMYHLLRGNARLVNIERNFPVKAWVEDGENTISDQADALNQYSGPSAGSEFETQLVMALINSITPNVFIDHHNYGKEQDWQFYTECCNKELINPMYQALIDCSAAFKADLPAYFGSGFGLVVDEAGGFPGSYSGPGANGGLSYRWMYQVGYKAALISEISWCINYLNGEIASSEQDKFGDDTFSVALFTLENVMKRLCEYENLLTD